MTTSELHPVAREVLNAFASSDVFRSLRFCQSIAEKDPAHCVKWAVQLIEPNIAKASPPKVVAETMALIQSLIKSPDAAKLSLLHDMAWQCWCCGSNCDNSPFLQRAVSRLAWATIALVCVTIPCSFAAERFAISTDANSDAGMATLTTQCALAIDMTVTKTNGGRWMVAADFTRQIASLC